MIEKLLETIGFGTITNYIYDNFFKSKDSIDKSVKKEFDKVKLITTDESKTTQDTVKKESQDIKELIHQKNDNKSLDTLTTALTGHANKFIPDMVHNVSSATANHLMNLDQRLKVDISYKDNVTNFIFSSKNKEGVKLTPTIKPSDPIEFQKNWEDLFHHGKPFKSTIEEINIKGSKIFDELLSNQEYSSQEISIEPTPQKSLLKLWQQNELGDFFPINDIELQVYSGTKSLSMEGKIFDGIVNISTYVNFHSRKRNIEFTFNVDFSRWNGVEINHLPYFDNVYKFFFNASEGWKLHGTFEKDGIKIVDIDPKDMSNEVFIKEVFNELKYIFFAREIAKSQNISICFTDYSFTSQLLDRLNTIYLAIQKGEKRLKSNELQASSDVIVNDENLDTFKNKLSDLNSTFYLEQPEKSSTTLTLFDTEVKLPKILHKFKHLSFKIDKDISIIKLGDQVHIDFTSNENSVHSLEFVEE
ncbi:hypothetical protein [Sulfurovum sp. TSL1]|uniref:hypothetical protein n=1 Tax=Sulfurovum sp. TSL1 TaxID=2826994 RepID=UPI001CC65962|nr:hypothetical protein [Sulfurovum sp. TSL1]GIT98688.1 hypothetical protein TSL1_15090 [Sulfurovum sp. TSL1]